MEPQQQDSAEAHLLMACLKTERVRQHDQFAQLAGATSLSQLLGHPDATLVVRFVQDCALAQHGVV